MLQATPLPCLFLSQQSRELFNLDSEIPIRATLVNFAVCQSSSILNQKQHDVQPQQKIYTRCKLMS